MRWIERLELVVRFALITYGLILPFFFRSAFLWTEKVSRGQLFPLCIALVVFLSGVAAHRFKQHNQFYYGVVEIAFGVVYAYGIAASVKSGQRSILQLAAALACTYVVARGRNNMTEAKAKRS